MEKNETKMQIPKIKLDDLFSTQEQRDNAKLEKIVDIKIDCIDDFLFSPKATDFCSACSSDHLRHTIQK